MIEAAAAANPYALPIMAGVGLLSLGGQLFGASSQADAMRASARAQAEMQRQAIAEQRRAYGEIKPYYEPYMQTGQQGLQGMQGDFSTQMGNFDYNKDVNSFLDPSMQFQQDQMNRALQQSAIARNGMNTGAFAKELGRYNSQLAQTDYANANQRMQTDKNFAYQNFMNDFASRQSNNQLRLQQFQNMANMGQNAVSGLSNARMGQATNIASNMGNIGQAQGYGAQAGGMAMGQTVQNLTSPQNLMGMYSMYKELGG